MRKITYEQNKKFSKEIETIKTKNQTNSTAEKYNDWTEEFNRQLVYLSYINTVNCAFFLVITGYYFFGYEKYLFSSLFSHSMCVFKAKMSLFRQQIIRSSFLNIICSIYLNGEYSIYKVIINW